MIVRSPNVRPTNVRAEDLLRKRRLVWLLALVGVLAIGVAGGIALRRNTFNPSPSSQPTRPPTFDIATADEAAILAARSTVLQVFRSSAAPAVLVLSFPTLGEQGRMLDRLGAFVEKAGLPRERVLSDAELDAAIRQAGDTWETYYYGHDYRAADLVRFFSVADQGGIALNPEEVRLRALLEREGMLTPGAVGALISIPPEVETPPVDATSRATILRHELSHGIYFTDPRYATYTRSFWEQILNDAQRAGLRRFLGSEGYDTANEDLMMNEAQAYLVHTLDPRFFQPPLAGLSDAEAARLREVFLRGMPDGWLKAARPVNAP